LLIGQSSLLLFFFLFFFFFNDLSRTGLVTLMVRNAAEAALLCGQGDMLQDRYHCLSVFSCTSILKIQLRRTRSIHALISSSSQSPLVLSHSSSISANLSVTTHSSFVLTGYIEMDLGHAIWAPHLFHHPIITGIRKVKYTGNLSHRGY
jgi:hypothetical protein